MAWRITADMRRFSEALSAFKRRVVISTTQTRELGARARENAFWIAGATQLDVVREVFERIDEAIAQGTPFSAFKRRVREAVTKLWAAGGGARIETIARNAIQKAYNAGRWHQMQEPAVRAFRPYWMFDAVLDSRTTKFICRPLDGTILPAEHAFWLSLSVSTYFDGGVSREFEG